ncbi:glycine/sarcosine/betaine reductase selenoprotein B family protein [Alkalicoccus halolimnae]|uniref:Glycine/sarcosine/betaine reductase selenoprotein B family protein n=1 Tax=Alkalicoccus halolimnae TaxID=1667239 RepID=A0A5C7F5C4_9BACI|nr:glycine/sarcosine/betaine reductase selenoprotein B family protein [Alkalicoccus halolimnae]TXF85881.1 hypothetical protein FTX54_07325 [Alkalicoccus halolimnae]
MISKIKDLIFQKIAKRSIKKHGSEVVDPLQQPKKPMNEWRVAFLTTAGIHLKEEAPFDVEAGDWSVRYIPSTSVHDDLTVSHTHYDTKAAEEDVNTVLPVKALQELEKEGTIGSLTPTFFGMMGYIPRVDKLMNESVPLIIKRLKEEHADVVLLSPG